jgi:hypothetical protein
MGDPVSYLEDRLLPQDMVPTAREARLPVWARDLLANLRRQVLEANREAHEAHLTTKPEDSDTILNPFERRPIGLGRGALVRFNLFDLPLPEGRYRDDHYIDVRIQESVTGRLPRRVQIMGGGMVLLQPKSGNTLDAWVSDR